MTLEDAAAQLPQIISKLAPGERLVIVDNGKPLATIIRNGEKPWACKAGSARNTDHWMADDFDAPLEDFREYMP